MMRDLSFGLALAAVTSLPLPVAHAQPSVPEACAVLSEAEVASILGRNVYGRPTAEKGPGAGESSCRFHGRVPAFLTISLGPSTKANFDVFRKMLVDQRQQTENIADVGDSAYFWYPDRVIVLTGRTLITVSFSSEKAGTEKLKQEMIALARAVTAKLKG